MNAFASGINNTKTGKCLLTAVIDYIFALHININRWHNFECLLIKEGETRTVSQV